MGNNYEKHFSKSKRKVLILGLPETGKTSKIINYLFREVIKFRYYYQFKTLSKL